jgi:dedicator of cytokinesis protein 3
VIYACLQLHGQLCPPEFIPFHETLDNFFKKNFREEIHRLRAAGVFDQLESLPSIARSASQYQASISGTSINRSASTASTTRPPVNIPPIQVSRSVVLTPPPHSPKSSRSLVTVDTGATAKQTPLQRHLAYLARHGINGVSSAPGEVNGGSESVSAESPRDSLVNINSNGMTSAPPTAYPTTPAPASNLVSLSGSIKGRLSRFGSLNFGRRGGTTS